jgi:hypothetical protein
MGLFSFNKKAPSQYQLGKSNGLTGSHFTVGLGYSIDEYNLYSQVKDYRTDLLNGTAWRATDPVQDGSFAYIQFLKLLSKYSTAIYNDFNLKGFAVLAKIEGVIYYISPNNYTKNEQRISIHGYSNAEVFVFDEPNAFCGEKTIYQKCEPYQKLYNIALSCQKNGMSKSGFVSVISPKTPSGVNVQSYIAEEDKKEIEKSISESHGVATDEQRNFLIFPNEIDLKTISFDAAKIGILDTKKLCEEYVCSKLGVPYVLLPSSGQTFTNYEQANKILYENHSKYCEYFCKFVKNEIGFDIDYKTIAELGKGII